jgi:hypothetical protein
VKVAVGVLVGEALPPPAATSEAVTGE